MTIFQFIRNNIFVYSFHSFSQPLASAICRRFFTCRYASNVLSKSKQRTAYTHRCDPITHISLSRTRTPLCGHVALIYISYSHETGCTRSCEHTLRHSLWRRMCSAHIHGTHSRAPHQTPFASLSLPRPHFSSVRT